MENQKNIDTIFEYFFHYLSNDVGSISTITEFLSKDNLLDDSEKLNLFDSLNTTTSALSYQINNIVSWFYLVQEKLLIDSQEILLKDLVSQLIGLFDKSITKKNIKVKNKINPKFKLNSDENLVLLTILNVFRNSVKYSKQDGFIEINTKALKKSKEIIISDTGKGITKKDFKNLFNIQNRVRTIGTAGENGMGLGLYFTREFLKVLNADIKIQSTWNQGTTVKFIFYEV